METTPGVIASHLLGVDHLTLVNGVLLLVTLQQAEEDHGERAMRMAGIRQKEPEVQVALRRKDLWTRQKGVGAKEVAAAVPGTKQMVVDGTAARARTQAVVVAGGKLGQESAVPDLWAMYIKKGSALCTSLRCSTLWLVPLPCYWTL